jgi:hypothetical protein
MSPLTVVADRHPDRVVAQRRKSTVEELTTSSGSGASGDR